MKARYGRLISGLSALVLAVLCAPASWAGCVDYHPGAKPSGMEGRPGSLSLEPAAYLMRAGGGPSIVGFWHFVQKSGINVFDAGYEHWHADGTELYVSGLRPPDTGDVCMGVWQQVGLRHYRLNHRAIGYEPSGTTPAYVAAILEDVYLSPTGNSFAGTYRVIAYDTTGHLLQVISAGKVTANRVSVADSVPGPLF